MSQPLTPGKYVIINVAQQRTIGLRGSFRYDSKRVCSLDRGDLTKIWNVKSVDNSHSSLTIGGFASTLHVRTNLIWGQKQSAGGIGKEWIIEPTANGANQYTIRSTRRQNEYWTLENKDNNTQVSVHGRLESPRDSEQHWRIISDFDLRGLAIIHRPHTAKSKPYFAYGSNLSLKQMQNRCEFSSFVCVAVLRDWEWIINEVGVANIVASTTDDIVYGFLYDLREEDEADLDGYEGSIYVKTTLQVEIGLGDGVTNGRWRNVDALTYVDMERTTKSDPREEYIPRMKIAISDALDKGVPQEYVNKYMAQFL